jgi:hypothetical protein
LGVELGVADGEYLPLGQGASQELEVPQVAGDLVGVAVQGEMAEGTPPSPVTSSPS